MRCNPLPVLLLAVITIPLCSQSSLGSDPASLLRDARSALDRNDLAGAEGLASKVLEYGRTYDQAASLAEAHQLQGEIERRRTDWKAAEASFREALRYRRRQADSLRVAILYRELAQTKDYAGDFEAGLYYAHQSVRMLDSLHAPEEVGRSLVRLANLYKSTGDYASAESRYREAGRLLSEAGDSLYLAISWYNLADTYYRQDSLARARRQLLPALRFFENRENWRRLALVYNLRGGIDWDEDDLAGATAYYLQSIRAARLAGDSAAVSDTYYNLSLIAEQRGDLRKALSWISAAEAAFPESGGLEDRQYIAQQYADLYGQLALPETEARYLREVNELTSELYNQKVAEAQEKYKAELLAQQYELSEARRLQEYQKSRFFTALTVLLAILSAALVVILVQAYRHARQRRKLNVAIMEQQVLRHRREVDKLLSGVHDSVQSAQLAGIRQERKRLGKQLHDMVSSQLAATRWLQEKHIMTLSEMNINTGGLQNVLTMLNQAYHYLRDVEANMEDSPDDWVKDLKTFHRNLSRSTDLKIKFLTFGLEKNIPPDLALDIKSVILTLTANVLNYAKAKKLSIQIARIKDELSIFVEDDGQGFDPARTQGGNGLRNTKERVEKWDGVFKLDSQQGKGTVITIWIPLTEPPNRRLHGSHKNQSIRSG